MKTLFLSALLTSLPASALALNAMQAEEQYFSYSEGLEQDGLEFLIDGTGLTRHHKKILVDSLWDFTLNPENASRLSSSIRMWKRLDFNSMPLPEKVRLYLLGLRLGLQGQRLETMKESLQEKLKGKLDNRTLIIVFNHEDTLRSQGFGPELDDVEVTNLKVKAEYKNIVLSHKEKVPKEELSKLLGAGEKGKPFLYLACRGDRNWPCLLTLKDKNGNFVRNEDETLWSLPALGKSKYEMSFNHENGNTPNGVYLIESVMPAADRQIEFGKNRRLIIKMQSKAAVLKLLPETQHGRYWWRQLLLAMELGRENLRIHGTGKINADPSSTYPTLVPSSGCIKLREGKYEDVVYNDQRLLLNALMKAQGLKVSRSNEAAIRANLMVFNLQGDGPVEIEEIEEVLK